MKTIETTRSGTWIALAIAIVATAAVSGCGKRGGSSTEGASASASGKASPGVLPAGGVQGDQPFAGTYTKYAVSTFKNGQRVVSTNNSGVSTLTIAQGLVTWAQTYTSNNQLAHVTQTYTFTPADVRPVTGGYDVTLTFQKMDSDTNAYNADKNSPKLQARKQTAGWQIGLLTTDTKGVSGGVEFK